MAGKKPIKEVPLEAPLEATVDTIVESVPIVKGDAPEEPKGVFLPLATAKRIYELYTSVEAAEAHFHSCQSANFREHVRSVIKAPKIEKAFSDLKGFIESVEGGK